MGNTRQIQGTQWIRELAVLQGCKVSGCFYENDEEFKVVISECIGKAVQQGRKILVLARPHTAHDVEGLFKSTIKETLRGRKDVLSWITDSSNNGRDHDALTDMFHRARKAMKDGWPGVWIYIDMKALMDDMPGLAGIQDTIGRIETFNEDEMCAVVCMYDRRVCAPDDIMDAIQVHPRIIISGSPVQNMYYRPFGRRSEIDAVSESITYRLDMLAKQKLRDDEFKKLKEEYRFLFENTSDILYVHDLEGRFTEINLIGSNKGDYKGEDLVGVSLRDFIPKELTHGFADYLKRIKENGKDQGILRVADALGNTRIFEYKNILLKDEFGPSCVRGVAQDITGRFKAKQSLKKSEEKYRLLAENIHDLIWTADLDLNFTYVSPSVKAMTGATVEEALQLNVRQVVKDKEAFRKVRSEIDTALEQIRTGSLSADRTVRVELEHTRSDGTCFWADINASVQFDAKGKPIGFVGITRDVTDKVNAQNERRKNEMKYRTLLESIEEGYYEVDLAGNILFFNDVFCSMIGYSKQEMQCMRYRTFMDRLNARRVLSVFSNVYLTGRPEKGFGWEFIKKDGSRIQVESSVMLMKGEDDKPIGFRGVLRDITQRKQYEKDLLESEKKFREIYEGISEMVYKHDLEGFFIESNIIFTRVLGYEREDVGNRNVRDIMPERFRPQFKEYLERINKNGKDDGLMVLVTKDGRERIVEYSNKLISGHDETVIIQGHAIDVTDRVHAEKRMQKNEKRYRDMFNKVNDYLYFHDLDGYFNFEDTNDTVKQAWGYKAGGRQVMNIKDYMPEQHLAYFNDYLKRVRKNGSDQGLITVVNNDGCEQILEYKNMLVLDKGIPVGIQGTARDITDRIKASRALKKSETKYRTVLENMEESYYEVDLKGNLIFFNDSVCKILGYSREELTGMNYRRFAEADSVERMYQAFKRVLTTEKPDKLINWEFIKKDGAKRIGEGPITLIKDSKGKATGFQGIIRDITERKFAEKMREDKIKAEAENRAKSEFLANMSHEIRTPLNGIIGMTELAMDTVLDKNQKDIIKAANREADTLLVLINEILDFSKIEADKLEFESVPFDLRVMIEDLAGSFAIRSEKKNLEIIGFLAPDVPSHLIGDPGRLRQVLANFASNALKFTENGEIVIKAEMERDFTDKVKIRFTVRDTGIGIPPDKQGRVFESFTQADESTTRKYGGTGLGLTISKRIVEMMAGEIGLESEEGKGSSFWFTALLSKQSDPETICLSREVDLSGRRVLIVDDNETNRYILTAYLKVWGCIPDESCGGEETVKTLKAAVESEKPTDLILMDLHMPGLDGFKLAEKIREVDALKHIPIIMLTSLGDHGDSKYCRDVGIQGYLSKPTKRDDLHKAIISVMGLSMGDEDNSQQRLVTRHTIAEDFRKDVQILLAEDYPTNQKVATMHLQKAGYQVDIAEDGKQAVYACKHKHYDIVLMDIEMPVMNGYIATKEIREWEDRIRKEIPSPDTKKMNRVPIIAMTAHASNGYKDKCIEAGMDDYIAKPLRREKLLHMVDAWAKAGIDEPKVSRADGKTGQDSDIESMPGDPPIDYKRAMEEYEFDREFLDEMLEGFIDNVKDQIEIIRGAISNGNAMTLAQEAHSIKGAAANLTADDLSGVAYELEKIGKSGTVECGMDVLKRLEKEFYRLKHHTDRGDRVEG